MNSLSSRVQPEDKGPYTAIISKPPVYDRRVFGIVKFGAKLGVFQCTRFVLFTKVWGSFNRDICNLVCNWVSL